MTTSELAIIDVETSTAVELQSWAVAVRDVIPHVQDEDRLDEIESVLVAIAHHLRKLGKDAKEAERSRVRALQRLGNLLGDVIRQFQGNQHVELSIENTTKLTQAQKDRRAAARLLADETLAEIIETEFAKDSVKLGSLVRKCRTVRAERQAAQVAPAQATVTLAPCQGWLANQPDCDLLITDPPYSTDVDDIYEFAAEWLPLALKRVKPSGRAYVCIGAYPAELHAYLSVPCGDMILANVLVWTYRNTLGPSPSHDYKLNWQAILYYRGPDAPPLDSPRMTEQFSVQDISAPDGRQADRHHAWQKPVELAQRLIRHSTSPGDLVLDPFAGTGTFLITAAQLGRVATGCDADPEMIRIAETRGCVRV